MQKILHPRIVADSEFDLIRRLFAPLAKGEPGAFGLEDDAAVLLDTDFVVTKDLLVAGVHFLPKDPLDLVARKAVRVNLSDLAAKGARPFGYFLGCVWPKRATGEGIALFAKGLEEDQKAFKFSLLGGDTTVHADNAAPLTISITMLGLAARDGVIRRNGAKPGDDVYVTGAIGDAKLGLAALQGERFSAADKKMLVERFRLPVPRLSFGGALAGVANASIDVSDGLLADAGHIAATSKVAIEITASRIPLSDAAKRWVERQAAPESALVSLATFGDDYEILFTALPSRRRAIEMASQVTRTPITKIGAVKSGTGVRFCDDQGAQIEIDTPGYDHFSK